MPTGWVSVRTPVPCSTDNVMGRKNDDGPGRYARAIVVRFAWSF